ncbi:DUF6515 family protein [Aquimarina rhabdastrellae]
MNAIRYVFSVLTIMCLSVDLNAQQVTVKKKKNNKKVVVKKNNRKVTVTRTPRTKVVYKSRAPRVTVVRTRPRNAVVVSYGGVSFHYKSGRYYRYNNGKYIVVTPPIGIRINVLPVGYTSVIIGGSTYYYYQGIYYISIPDTNEYERVEAPQEALVYILPEDTEEVVIDGKTYYESNDTLYKVVLTPDGKAFKVVGILEE